MPQGEVVATFQQYAEALSYVDNLLKNNFPAGSVAIVGSDLKTVERVRGKINYARMAISGAVTGSWLGLLFGLLFGTAADESGTALVPVASSLGSALVIGAGLGMLFNITRFGLSKNKRSFISQSSVVASKYEVQVPGPLADQARAVPSVQVENVAKTGKTGKSGKTENDEK